MNDPRLETEQYVNHFGKKWKATIERALTEAKERQMSSIEVPLFVAEKVLEAMEAQ